MSVKNTGLGQSVSIESSITLTFLPVEIELIRHQSTNTRFSTPPETETLIYHFMDLFVSYLTLCFMHVFLFTIALIGFAVLYGALM